MTQILFGLVVFFLCFLASFCGTEARTIESREFRSNNSLEIIEACRSGKLSNPTGEDWKNFEVKFPFATITPRLLMMTWN